MTDQEIRSEKLARQDLTDIGVLAENEVFKRYWLRRLAEKKKKIEDSFRNDPPSEKMTKEEREILRRIIKAYDELEQLMADDAAIIQRQLVPST